MKRIGLTGGIGSGKSTVARIFEVLNIPVYYADAASKRLMNEDEELKDKIKKAFGEDAYINGE
ncbi:MAG TPA: dephospho-CoA kinase, partial [Ginsengibacter sp.]